MSQDSPLLHPLRYPHRYWDIHLNKNIDIANVYTCKMKVYKYLSIRVVSIYFHLCNATMLFVIELGTYIGRYEVEEEEDEKEEE